MMARLMMRAERIARDAEERKVNEIADRLRELLVGATITVEDMRVIVSGRGLLKRWLSDPGLRFFGGML